MTPDARLVELTKRLARLKTARRSVKPQELDVLLLTAGFSRRRGRAQDSVYSHPKLEAPFAIPTDNPVRPTYVSRAIRAIEQVISGFGAGRTP
jgi:hypothetical protein